MIFIKSSGFNFDYDKFEDNARKGFGGVAGTGGKAVGKAGRGALRYFNKKGVKAVKKTGKFAKSFGRTTVAVLKALPKKILIAVLIFVFIFFLFYSCGYLASDENSGETGNRIDNNNTIIVGGTEGNINFSDANANCIAFYQLLSKNKSVYQEYVDESGNIILITPDNPNAVSDYFKSDKQYYINPDLLFCMNKYIFGDKYVYPEAFLKPVSYNKDSFSLEPLTDDKGRLIANSFVTNKDGTKKTQIKRSVSDYGIASVMRYKSLEEVKGLRGTYNKMEILEADGSVSEIEINEEFNIVTSCKNHNVLDKVITFAGNVEYEYTPTSTRTSSVKTAEISENEADNVEIFVYAKDTATFISYGRIIKDEDGNVVTGMSLGSEYPYTKRFMRYNETLGNGYSADYIEGWISGHSGEKEFELEDGTKVKYSISYTFVEETTKEYALKKYRSSDSGTYINFYTQSVKNCEDLGNQYLYDYLENFSCYYPTNVSRDYEILRKMTSQASNPNSILSSSNGFTSGSGNNSFERIYNGSEEGRKMLELIWDVLITWGYSEVQASAVIGNMGAESGYQPSVVNHIGASGLCQWLGGRKENLFNFAGSMNKDWTDIEAQVTYACMELDTKNRYAQCGYEWEGYPAYANTFETSDNVEEVTYAICAGWERPSESEIASSISVRVSCANSAYETLSGRTPEVEAIKIEPIGGENSAGNDTSGVYDTSYTTRSMNKADKELFNTFYHAMDDNIIYDGNHKFDYKSNPLSKTEVDNMLLLTNSYINGTSLEEERLNSVEGLWSVNYLTDLSKEKKDMASFYGVEYLDNPRLAVESVEGLKYWGEESPFYVSGRPDLMLPNCTTWVYGRRWEATGEEPPLKPNGNQLFANDAHSWWPDNEHLKVYKYGNTPKVGAIMCWRDVTNTTGHVCFVEQINADGTMTISQSGYKTPAWYPYNVKTGTIEEIERYNGYYIFQGYIYLEKY